MTKHKITPVTLLGNQMDTMVLEGSIPLNQDKFNVNAVIFKDSEGDGFGGRRNPSFRQDMEVVKADLPSVTEVGVFLQVDTTIGVTLVLSY